MIKEPKHSLKQFKRNLLCSAISICLPLSIQAADFPVTVSNDDGTGNTVGTLSHAIREANVTLGIEHNIILQTDVTVQGVMKRLIDSNVTIQSDGTRRTIDGNSQFRPLFVKSGNVTIQGVDIINGYASGGDGLGGGAGMGGSLFVYDGNVTLNETVFSGSIAKGGLSDNSLSGGGGMFGQAENGGGGLFASAAGGYGGTGGYYSGFGHGGDTAENGQGGYFGGGGGLGFSGAAGPGGFGGGGALGIELTFPGPVITNTYGAGGFGGGSIDDPGYGASANGAGMGGAVFIRSGNIDIKNSSFEYSETTASSGARGLGGGIFVMHTMTNSNGNNQGMPAQLATVTGCGNEFFANIASGASGVPGDNNDIFDVGGLAEDLTQLCPQEQNLIVTVAEDDGTGSTENTLSWAIKESNALSGDDTITLATDVTITGVMKRLIDSNVTIQSDDTRRSISGNGQYRPLFVKSGTVSIQGVDMINGYAKGGDGYSGGAGMGGGLFIYDGVVTIADTHFSYSSAIGGSGEVYLGGGGGMFGHGDAAGGGLFASAAGSYNGDGGYYGAFGRGGNLDGGNGQFGGGGGVSYIGSGGNGGFGGGGGDKSALSGDVGSGGFGGGSEDNPGFGATDDGAGMGGAVFIRSGQVTIKGSSFSNNAADGGQAAGFGGAIFVVHTTSNSNSNNQGMPANLADVEICDVQFSNNLASTSAGTSNNNNDWFDQGGQISLTECPIFKSGFE
ncbi:hypothetical protein OS175_08775 [Marinicella sp. S1101]|uniref:hypothetical protein n=1 Tax=Marinicella marina TaxID=2996016 RepID=UPI002260CD6E|nr:hypothetical protein [Marinicella marina]MCX7553971.1 hypothetical protein [Marinicella marina]MDJ1140463.1 hypothetical protein [Marinicella marina]